jgi:hypothetical protein
MRFMREKETSLYFPVFIFIFILFGFWIMILEQAALTHDIERNFRSKKLFKTTKALSSTWLHRHHKQRGLQPGLLVQALRESGGPQRCPMSGPISLGLLLNMNFSFDFGFDVCAL